MAELDNGPRNNLEAADRTLDMIREAHPLDYQLLLQIARRDPQSLPRWFTSWEVAAIRRRAAAEARS